MYLALVLAAMVGLAWLYARYEIRNGFRVKPLISEFDEVTADAYCDTGNDFFNEVELHPNASIKIESIRYGFYRVILTPINGAASSSCIMQEEDLYTLFKKVLR